MKILALDSSLEACSAALSLNKELSVEKFRSIPHAHSHLLLGMIDELLNENTLTLNELDLIAFAAGPGGFTGLRIATSIAQGLAFSAELPVFPVSTLQVIAQGMWRETKIKNVVVNVDARMGQWYQGKYQLSSKGIMEPTEPDRLIPAEDTQPLQTVFLPHAQDVAVLAMTYCMNKANCLDPALALPIYLRGEEAWKKMD